MRSHDGLYNVAIALAGGKANEIPIEFQRQPSAARILSDGVAEILIVSILRRPGQLAVYTAFKIQFVDLRSSVASQRTLFPRKPQKQGDAELAAEDVTPEGTVVYYRLPLFTHLV